MRFLGPLLLGCCVVCVLGACVDEAARERERDEQAAVESLLNAERDFAARVKAGGIKAGFLSVLHPDGVLFNPTPTNGIALYEAAPESDAMLMWEPRYVELASSLDLGYTTGPWEFFVGDTASEAVAFGDYFAIWKKDAIGVWKLLLEIGVFRDAPQPMHELQTRVLDPVSRRQSSSTHQLPPQEINLRRIDLSRSDNLWRAAGSYTRGTSGDIRIIRDSILRIIGQDNAGLAALPKIHSRELGVDISSAGDLGFVFGTVEATVRGPGGGRAERIGGYVRIWRQFGLSNEKVIEPEGSPPLTSHRRQRTGYTLTAEVMSMRPKQ